MHGMSPFVRLEEWEEEEEEEGRRAMHVYSIVE
jgi:hypothetical protein